MSRSHAGCQGLGEEFDFIPPLRSFPLGKRETTCKESRVESVQGGGRSFLPGRVGISTMWSLRNGASSTSPVLWGLIPSSHPPHRGPCCHHHPHHSIINTQRGCVMSSRSQSWKKWFLLAAKLFSLLENSANWLSNFLKRVLNHFKWMY